jgi:hypothetical protein
VSHAAVKSGLSLSLRIHGKIGSGGLIARMVNNRQKWNRIHPAAMAVNGCLPPFGLVTGSG